MSGDWCPYDENPLNYLVDQHSYTSSCVVGITGFKRNGKSLLLSSLLTHDMLVLKRKVWSTMPVHTPACMLKDYGMQHSLPIDWDSLYMLDKEYEYGTIGLDESIYWDDSRSSMTMRNRLMNIIMNQVGHRNLNVYYTVKTEGWLDRRLQFETDLRIKCEDLGRTPWGRSNHVTKGDVIRLEFFDLSCYLTNKAYNEKYNYLPFQTLIWHDAHKFWDAFDSKELVGIEEVFTNVKVDMKQRTISNKPAYDTELQGQLYNIANEFYSKGNSEIETETFRSIVSRMGIELDPRQMGRYLVPLGITRKEKRGGNVYDLSKLVARGA